MDRQWLRLRCCNKELNLKYTLGGGQSFRWKETSEGEWTGVLGEQVWRLRWSPREPSILEYKVWQHESSRAMSSEDLEKTITSYLQLHTDLGTLYSVWSKRDPNFKKTTCIGFEGIRILRQHPVENIFSFICSSNNNIARISRMVENLCNLFGKEICCVDGIEYHSFPTLQALARRGVEPQVRQVGFGYRAPFIVGTASKIISEGGDEWIENLIQLDYHNAKQALMTLPGIGAKVADCICLMSLGHLQAVPVDTHVYQIACSLYTPHLAGRSLTTKVYDEISGHFQHLFGPMAGWAHTVLFCADLKTAKKRRSKTKSAHSSKKQKKK